jgi:hypothetical protein
MASEASVRACVRISATSKSFSVSSGAAPQIFSVDHSLHGLLCLKMAAKHPTSALGHPLYPRKRTPGGHRAMSVWCQFRTQRLCFVGKSDPAYLNSCPYLRAIALICSRVNSFRGSPGRLQVSRKKPSRPGGTGADRDVARTESRQARPGDHAA